MSLGRYGVDAPGLVLGFLLAGMATTIAGFALLHWAGASTWASWVACPLFGISGYALFMFCYMLWGSLAGKVRARDSILDLIFWHGHEQVLDVGCGRGLLLVGAAHRLTTGKAIGVDLWVQEDQHGNTSTKTLENAQREGVAARVQVQTGDMRQLPFADEPFDVVVSSWAVHNLELERDRQQALAEMARVLKPRGAILLNDIVNRTEYAEYLKRLSLTDVRIVVASKWSDTCSGVVSFGSFRPATVAARKQG